jgi:hypothetical protein
VREFERIEFDAVEAIARGTYITLTLAARDLDEKKNVGFVIRINSKGKDLTRRSLASDLDDGGKKNKKGKRNTEAKKSGDQILAFKALPLKSSFVGTQQQGGNEPPSELELTKVICDQIVRIANAAKKRDCDDLQKGNKRVIRTARRL